MATLEIVCVKKASEADANAFRLIVFSEDATAHQTRRFVRSLQTNLRDRPR